MFLIGFPLLLIPFAIYNIVAFLMPGVSWSGTLATVPMKSGADWAMAGGDVLVALAILLLFVEMMKVGRMGRRGVVEHGLSLLLFAAMVAEFVLVRQAASATFFLIVVTSFFDALGGFSLTLALRASRRDVIVTPAQAVERVEAAAEPAPSSPAPVAPAPERGERTPS